MATLNVASLGSPYCQGSLFKSPAGAQPFPWPFYKQLAHRNLLNTSFFLLYVIWLIVVFNYFMQVKEVWDSRTTLSPQGYQYEYS